MGGQSLIINICLVVSVVVFRCVRNVMLKRIIFAD